ncbi:threonine/serine dehydratase [Ferrovibrio xuzhouensis]|uniref:Threonine/serine dehydratase n=1 Tax=Ferrovibrio xuzhouensis TaxID=1576914 RepID=A0ABV7VJQ6_9PROT
MTAAVAAEAAIIDRAGVEATLPLIRSHVRRTPVLEVAAADLGLAGDAPPVTLKLEFLQHAGSFKPRGAFTNLLTRQIPAAGVVAASGGNHGAAVAYAAKQLGIPAKIFIPEVASPTKVAQIRGYGAALVISGQRYADALAASEEWIAQSGALAVHAYDHPATLLGQGTVALEWAEQAPELDTVLVAVGGGGLIGGMAAYYAGGTRLIGVEPEAAPTLTMALDAGRPVEAPAGGVAADSLAPKQIGALAFEQAQRHVAATVLVTDDAIVAAQRRIWESFRIVAEPGGAAALAAVLSGRYRPQAGERIGVLMCGANSHAVDFGR